MRSAIERSTVVVRPTAAFRVTPLEQREGFLGSTPTARRVDAQHRTGVAPAPMDANLYRTMIGCTLAQKRTSSHQWLPSASRS